MSWFNLLFNGLKQANCNIFGMPIWIDKINNECKYIH
jgi:hypothetical protein